MPLNLAQRDFIKASIIHFLDDLPDLSLDALKETTAQLKEIFSDEQLSESHIFFMLQKALKNPTEFFHRIETFNADHSITLFDVRRELLAIITEQLRMATTKIGIDFDELEWAHDIIESNLSAYKDSRTPFQSTPSQFDTRERPRQLEIRTDGQIYDAVMILEREWLQAQVQITIRLSDHLTKEIVVGIADLPGFYGTQADIDRRADEFLFSLLPEAKTEAELAAVDSVIKHLLQNEVIDSDSNRIASPYARLLLTYQFYYGNIKALNFFLNEFIKINRFQFLILTEQAIISLIGRKIISITDAKNLSATELKLIKHPVYFQMISNGEISLKALSANLKNYNAIAHPAIANLIKANIFDIYAAKKIRQNLLRLIVKESFFQLLLRRKFNIQWLIQLDKKSLLNLRELSLNIVNDLAESPHLKIIITPFYFRNLKKQNFTVNELIMIPVFLIPYWLKPKNQKLLAHRINVSFMRTFTEHDFKMLESERVYNLFYEHHITFVQLQSLNESTKNLICCDDEIYQTLRMQKPSMAPSYLHLKVWALHFHKILLQHSDKPSNTVLVELNDKFNKTITNENLSRELFSAEIIRSHLLNIREKLSLRSPHAFSDVVIKIISNAEQVTSDYANGFYTLRHWHKILESVCSQVKKETLTVSRPVSLFKKATVLSGLKIIELENVLKSLSLSPGGLSTVPSYP